MGRREDIEEQLNKDYELLKNLEDRLRTEIDPRLELRLNEDIGKLKQQIDNRQKELETLSTSSVPNKNASDNKSSDKESSPVTMTFNAPVYGVAGNIQDNQNINTSKQTQSLSQEEIQEVQKQQQKILILSAIPHGLRLDKEIREIEEAIHRAAKRDLFEIRVRTAVRPQDIRRAIAEEKPQIVHFCGHGLEDGNLLLEDGGGNNKPIAPEALAFLFKLHTDYVQCVLINACYSEKPAEAIRQYIDYVIGMNNPIEDKAAIEFAKGFYDGLGYELLDNQDLFQRAFDEGLAAAMLENISQGQIPVLKKKVIIEPNSIYPPLSEIPVTGNEASEVGADYTKLREYLKDKEFGKADLETANNILWVAKRDDYGWLDREHIENFPSQDLQTIDQLWLAASNGKYGFSGTFRLKNQRNPYPEGLPLILKDPVTGYNLSEAYPKSVLRRSHLGFD